MNRNIPLIAVLFLVSAQLLAPRTVFAHIAVTIDIKPGGDINPVNTNSRGVIPVAILGSDRLPAADIDVPTIRFGTDNVAPAGERGGYEDVNGDGVLDLVVKFREALPGIGADTTELCLSGLTRYGVAFSGCDSIRPLHAVDAGLLFPFSAAEEIVEVYCFGLTYWSPNGEIHNGIDIIPRYLGMGYVRYELVAPADAVVERIYTEGESGHGARTFALLFRMNDYWITGYVVEPQSLVPWVIEDQLSHIYVHEGQRIAKGQVIGELVVSETDLVEGSYPHVHNFLLYMNPEDTLEDLLENSLDIERSDGTDLPPMAGKGSPWDAEDLGIPTTFFCPYEYSTAETRVLYDGFDKRARHGYYCDCVCAYGSVDGDCGLCQQLPPP